MKNLTIDLIIDYYEGHLKSDGWEKVNPLVDQSNKEMYVMAMYYSWFNESSAFSKFAYSALTH